jgi:hypothetical protein
MSCATTPQSREIFLNATMTVSSWASVIRVFPEQAKTPTQVAGVLSFNLSLRVQLPALE